MSGAGRRTKYRKHVEQDILEGTPEPGENEHVVRVVASRGGNMLEVENDQGEMALCLLPAKFRKLVWVKRGNFLIATFSGEDFETAAGKGKVKYTVKHILFRDQIKHLNKVGLWPAAFGDEEQAAGRSGDAAQAESAASELEALSLSGSDDNATGLEDAVHEESDDEDELFVNPNRRKAVAFMDDSDSSDDDDDFGDDDGASERAEADDAETTPSAAAASAAADQDEPAAGEPAACTAAVSPDSAALAAAGDAAPDASTSAAPQAPAAASG